MSANSSTASSRIAATANTPPTTPTNLHVTATTPTNLHVTATTTTSASFAWDPSTDNSGSFSYVLVKDGQSFTVPGTQPAYTVDWLSPGRTYSSFVKVDGAGNRAISNAVILTTQASSDAVPPTAPTNLRIAENQGCAEVWLAWTQSTDNVDPQSAIEYEIYVNGELSPLAVSAGADREFVYGTVAGQNVFTVNAVDRTGNTWSV